MSRSGAEQTGSSLVERNIQLVMRGAARLLGCGSASYLRFDEASHTVRIWVGTMDEVGNILKRVEQIVGTHLGGGVIGWKPATGSIVFESLRTGRIMESSSIADLVGQAIPSPISAAMDRMIGPRKYASVPVTGQSGILGIILFEKVDDHPFSPSQRELLISYATRIGLVLESERFADDARVVLRDLGGSSLPGSSVVMHALTRFLEDAAEAMISLDQAQTITGANPRAEEMFGIAVDDLKGRPFEVLFHDAESSHRVLESRMHLVSEGFFEMRARVQRGDGKDFPAFVSGLVSMDEKGEHVGAIVRIRDLGGLAGQARAEEDLRRRLVRAERLAMMGEMAAQVAHEIRNPLVSIGASLREIVADVESGEMKAPELGPELLVVADEVDRLDAILRDYLALARRPAITPARIQVGIVLEDAVRVAFQNPAARDKSVDVSGCRDDEVLADADALRQVFINLLVNAIEASPPGTHISCRTTSNGSRVTTEIEDRGRGLPHGVSQEKLFEPFFSTKTRGSGLGLAVSRKIVEDLGGQVFLEQVRDGQGALARIVLPVPGAGRGAGPARAEEAS